MDMQYYAKKGYDLGRKYGVIKGVRKYLDETGMTGAVGIVVALGAVLIGLYIIAIVVGSMGTQVTGGNILLSTKWNTTISNIDNSAGSTFSEVNVKKKPWYSTEDILPQFCLSQSWVSAS